MKAVGIHSDVIVCWSRVWQTTCTALRSGEEAVVVDSPVFPDELELLPAVLDQAGFSVVGLLVTHADWDHLLGRAAFGEGPIGCAESTAARLASEPGVAQRELRAFDDEHYVSRAPLGLGSVQALPVPGYCAVGERELELHAAGGHTADGMAVWVPWASVLVCGDYLSPVEIPVLSPGGSLDGYRATLERLRVLVERAEAVVPGHGPVLDRAGALRVLDEDAAYLADLSVRGHEASLPTGRSGPVQREVHAGNVERIAARADP